MGKLFKKKRVQSKNRIHTVNCKKYISKKYFTMVIIGDPTKRAKTIQLPKWIKFPVVLVAILMVILFTNSIYFTLKAELNAEAYRKEAQTAKKENNNNQVYIDELEEEREEQLKKLEELIDEADELIEMVYALDGTQTELVELLNVEVNPTDKVVGELIVIEEDPKLADDSDSDSIRYDDNPRQYLSGDSDEFDLKSQQLEARLDGIRQILENKESNISLIESNVDSVIESWRKMPSIRPVSDSYSITSSFGWRSNPFTGTSSEYHSGIDFGCPTGTSVLATADGEVIETGNAPTGYGYYITIDHGDGILTRYAHNSTILVSVGQMVERGQVIARSGSTGRSTGPHLHYEVIKNNAFQNPTNYFN